MSGARIEITADDRQVQATFAQILELSGDLLPVMEDIGGALVTSTKLRFETGKGPDHVPWKKSRRALEAGGKTLVDRGLLRDSIHFEASASQVLVGTNDQRAAAHQFGAVIVPKTAPALSFKVGDNWVHVQRVVLPRREFLGLDFGDVTEIRDIAMDHLQRASTPPAGGAAA